MFLCIGIFLMCFFFGAPYYIKLYTERWRSWICCVIFKSVELMNFWYVLRFLVHLSFIYLLHMILHVAKLNSNFKSFSLFFVWNFHFKDFKMKMMSSWVEEDLDDCESQEMRFINYSTSKTFFHIFCCCWCKIVMDC
jgi:hypothetical protein